jgi:hypothetical protein
MTKSCTLFLLLFSLGLLRIPPAFPQDFEKTERLDSKKGAYVKTSNKKPSFLVIKNNGQLYIDAEYYTNGKGHKVYFNKDTITFTITNLYNKKRYPLPLYNETKAALKQSATFSLKPIGTSNGVELIAGKRLSGRVNYLMGKNPENWHTDIPVYREIVYKNLYNGIDLKIYGTKGRMEYDFIVSPHADPAKIQIACEGIDTLKINEKGDLIIHTPLGKITHLKPAIYQSIRGTKHSVEGSFAVAKNTFSFNIKTYDTNHTLIIDPLTLSYSTYLGGSSEDLSQSIAVDSTGSAYITGITNSDDFPIEQPFQSSFAGDHTIFITKINPSGDALVYSTYIGGSGNDRATGIAVDSTGSACITGETSSEDFPVKRPYQDMLAGGYDAFITKLTPSGNDISFSTYLGGSQYDTGSSLTVDSSGSIYVAGTTRSSDLPVKNAFQKTIKKHLGLAILTDTFVAKLTNDGSALIYATYLGGSGQDKANSIAVDQSGNAYITGETSSADFPVRNAFQGSYAGITDAFVCKLNSEGDDIIYSTYLGGSYGDSSGSIAVDSSGFAYIAGETVSRNFPVLNAHQNKIGGGNHGLLYFGDAFAAKIGLYGDQLLYATYLGGSGQDRGNGIAVDRLGNAYIIGETSSIDFPIINAFQGILKGKTDAFLSIVNPEGKKLTCSTYLGGGGQDIGRSVVVDLYGSSYLTGLTYSDDFPLEKPLAEKAPGRPDAFITKIEPLDEFFLPDGDVAPFGSRDGIIDVGDALICLQFALGLKEPSQEDLMHADVSPLNSYGIPQPDGQITVGDALLILRKAIGIISF